MTMAQDKRAARLFRKVAKELIKYSADEETYGEEADMYTGDAQDYKKLAAKCDVHDRDGAIDMYDKLDTASRDHFFDFLTDIQAEWLDSYLDWDNE